MRILIVDDRPLGARKLRDDILTAESDYKVEIAVTDRAASAAERAKQVVRGPGEHFDVFLIDDNMGAGVNGTELMAELRLLSPTSEAIIFTAYGDEAGKQRAIEAGARAYITRPVNEKELIWQLHGVQRDQETRRERDWLHLLAATTKELQAANTIEDAGQAIVKGAQQLGFRRARLRRVCEGQGEHIKLIGVSQVGNVGLADDYQKNKLPLSDLPYSRKVLLETRKPTLFHARELGEAPWDEYIGAPKDDWFKVPLFVGDTPIGTLSLDNGAEPIRYTGNDRQQLEQLLNLFSKQAAAALERARLQEQAEILSDIGRAATIKAAQGNLDALLAEVRQQVARLMNVDNFMTVLVDPDSSLLDFRLNYEQNQPLPRQWRDPDCGLVGYLIRENKPLWFPNGTEAAFREQHQVPLCGEMSQCWLGVPLPGENGVAIGALVVQHYEHPQQYSLSHQKLLEIVAESVSGAIDLIGQRERKTASRHRDEFIDRIRRLLPDLLQQREDWFWHLLLKFITDDCGLRFNRAVIFLAKNGSNSLHGHLGVGQLTREDAYRKWAELIRQREKETEQQCNPEHFVAHLRTRQLADHTPIEQKAASWTLTVAGETLRRIQETSKPEIVPSDQAARLLSFIPEAYRLGLEENPSAECVVAPLSANGRFLGMLITDNAFNSEPVRPEVLANLMDILDYAALLWEHQDARYQELAPAQREQLANLRMQALQAIQDHDLKTGLLLICKKAQELLQTDSVVIYPLARDGVTYLNDQISQVGLDPEKAKRDFKIRPRQHGLFAYVKRVGEVIIPDVGANSLRFLDAQGSEQPLEQHGFIRNHGIQAFMGLALRSPNTGDPLGAMYFNSKKPRSLINQEKTLAAELAEIAMLVLSTVRGSEALAHQQRTQELNRLRDVLEAALSPDADDTKAISALLANTMALLPAAERVDFMVLKWAEGQHVEDGNWRVYYRLRGETLVQEEEQAISVGNIAEQAFREKRLISVARPRQRDEREDDHTGQVAGFSAFAAPVHHSKRVVGVLQVTTDEAEGFDERDQARINELASAAGLVIGSLRHRYGLLGAVLKAAAEVTRPSSFDEAMQAVVDQAVVALDLECVTLWYLEPGSGKLVVGPFKGVNSPKHQKGDVVESTLVRSIMVETQPVWTLDVKQDGLFKNNEFIETEDIASTAAFPLWNEKVPVGALFFNYRRHHHFTREEKDAFPIFAAIAAASIRDAQLIEAKDRSTRRLQAALTVAKAASEGWERQETLPAILNALRDHFREHLAGATPYLLRYNSEDKVLELPEEVRDFYPPAIGHSDPIRLALDAKRVVCKVTLGWLNGEERKVVSIPDVTDQNQYAGYEHPDSQTRSELCAGLWREEKFLGVLVLKSAQRNAFCPEDEQLFGLVAEQVAVVIDRVERAAQLASSKRRQTVMAWQSEIAHAMKDTPQVLESVRSWFELRQPSVAGADSCMSLLAKHASMLREMLNAQVPTLDVVGLDALFAEIKEWVSDKEDRWSELPIEYLSQRPGLMLYGDRRLLRRSLQNLVINAVEAMTINGKVEGKITLLSREFIESRTIEIEVRDTGPGIPWKDRLRVGIDVWSSKEGANRGTGLYKTALFMEMMDGSLNLLPDLPNAKGARLSLRVRSAQAAEPSI